MTSLAVIPGALYLVAAEGLVRRRYWAWVMSLLVTVILMITILGAGYYFIAVVVPYNAAPGVDANADGFVFPILLYFSMPSLILVYMLPALPVIREAELLTFTGFSVLPPVRVQPIDLEERARRRHLEDEYENSAPGSSAPRPAAPTSPGRTPPAP